jgi:hypothetical protein
MLKRRILKLTMVLITIAGSAGGLSTLAAGSASAATGTSQPTISSGHVSLPGLNLVRTGATGPNVTAFTTMRIIANSNFCLDANINGGIRSGDNVQIWTCNGRANQGWRFNGNELQSQANTNFCLDANVNGGIRDGDNVQIWTCNGRANQQWIPVVGVYPSPFDALLNGASPRTHLFALDANINGGVGNGKNVQIWTQLGNNHQGWTVP